MKKLTLEEAGIFHGHLGPFLALGYVAGKYASEVLGQESEHDLEAYVAVPTETPYSCIIDGVQCSTLCTLGKGNIKVVNSGEFIIKVTNRRTGKSVELKLLQDVLEKLKVFGDRLDEAVRWVLEKGVQELFLVVRE